MNDALKHDSWQIICFHTPDRLLKSQHDVKINTSRKVQKVASMCTYAALRDIGGPDIDRNEVEQVDENELTKGG